MIRYLDVDEVLRLHALGIFRSGGSFGLRDVGLLESAVAQPQMSFGGHATGSLPTPRSANVFAHRLNGQNPAATGSLPTPRSANRRTPRVEDR